MKKMGAVLTSLLIFFTIGCSSNPAPKQGVQPNSAQGKETPTVALKKYFDDYKIIQDKHNEKSMELVSEIVKIIGGKNELELSGNQKLQIKKIFENRIAILAVFTEETNALKAPPTAIDLHNLRMESRRLTERFLKKYIEFLDTDSEQSYAEVSNLSSQMNQTEERIKEILENLNPALIEKPAAPQRATLYELPSEEEFKKYVINKFRSKTGRGDLLDQKIFEIDVFDFQIVRGENNKRRFTMPDGKVLDGKICLGTSIITPAPERVVTMQAAEYYGHIVTQIMLDWLIEQGIDPQMDGGIIGTPVMRRLPNKSPTGKEQFQGIGTSRYEYIQDKLVWEIR